jgi:murein DD-endopeptidase MepM/ murein hydrolase activator NlpD
MVTPVPGYKISTGYGIAGKHWKACGTHTGVDFQAPRGTVVVAAIAGTIRHRQYGSAFGPYQFAISPSAGQPFANDEVFYAHVLDRLPDGTEVHVGQAISHVGSLGNATGPHLHFEYHVGKNNWSCGTMRNPAPVIASGSAPPPPPPPPPAYGGP